VTSNLFTTISALGAATACGWLAHRTYLFTGPDRWQTSAERYLVKGLLFTVLLTTGYQFLGFISFFSGAAVVTAFALFASLTFACLITLRWVTTRTERSAVSPVQGNENLIRGLIKELRVTPNAKLIGLIGLVLFTTYAVFLIDALIRFPTGWDGLWFHLPLAVQWFQEGTLNLAYPVWGLSSPGNGELINLFLWNFGSEHLLNLAYLPFAVLSGLAVYGISRRIGVSRPHAFLAAVAYLMLPIVIFQAFNSYIDLFASTFVLTASFLVLAWSQGKNTSARSGRIYLMLAGLSYGLALGAKHVYVPYWPVFWVIIVLWACTEQGSLKLDSRHLSNGVRCLGIFVGCSLLTTAYWYIRNWVLQGNPLYPVPIKIFGIKMFSGLEGHLKQYVVTKKVEFQHVRNTFEWLFYPWIEFKSSGLVYTYDSGSGAVFATFFPLLIAAAFYQVKKILNSRRFDSGAVLLCFLGGSMVVWWFVLPHNLRFALVAFGFTFPLLGIMLDRVSPRAQRSLTVLFLFALVTTGSLATFQPLRNVAGSWYHGGRSRYTQYPVPPIIENIPPGSTILNLGPTRSNYPLVGSRWQHKVLTPFWATEFQRLRQITQEVVLRHGIDYIFLDGPSPVSFAPDLSIRQIFSAYRQSAHRQTRNGPQKMVLLRVE
jgi:hypothetical protein